MVLLYGQQDVTQNCIAAWPTPSRDASGSFETPGTGPHQLI